MNKKTIIAVAVIVLVVFGLIFLKGQLTVQKQPVPTENITEIKGKYKNDEYELTVKNGRYFLVNTKTGSNMSGRCVVTEMSEKEIKKYNPPEKENYTVFCIYDKHTTQVGTEYYRLSKEDYLIVQVSGENLLVPEDFDINEFIF